MSTHVEGHEYDIIFAGGGTAACVAAGRLARADPSLSILLVEGGKNNKNDPTVVNPAIYLAHLAPNSQTALFYKANKEEALNGREVVVPAGGMLGGGSSINFMMYTRAQAVDFDSWKTEGWDYESLLPLLKKIETFHPKDAVIDQSLHGHDGPINISFGSYFQHESADDVIAGALATGEKDIVDLQDFKQCGGFSRWAKYISPDGKRQDAAHRYGKYTTALSTSSIVLTSDEVHPLLEAGEYPNLHLLVENRVSKVLFDDNKRAIGIEYEPNKMFQAELPLSKTPAYKIFAKKQVVVSAGTLSTPSILERSGIGDPKILKSLGIDVISVLPDVGEHYQDHNLVLYPYKTALRPDETIDCLLSGRKDFAQAVGAGDKMLGWNAIDLSSKLRPTEAEVAQLGPEFQKLWEADFKNVPERPLMLCGVVSSFLGDHKILNEDVDGVSQYATMGNYTAYPYSRGNIHITTTDGQTPASFNTGFFTHDADIKKQLWAYKKQREIYRRTNAYRGELALGHPKFREGSKAALVDGSVAPKGGFKTAQDRESLAAIEYDEEDDRAIVEHLRENVSTTWHSCGTCRMAPRDKGGVVDKWLNVYGVSALKVVDLSILPENVGANTNNTALLVGEKAADIIGRELGIHV